MANLYLRPTLPFENTQQTAACPTGSDSPAHDIPARRLPVLAGDFLLLFLDPAELRGRKHTDCLWLHAERRGDPYLSRRGIDTQMNVLDVLLDYVNGYGAKLQRRMPSLLPLLLHDQENPFYLGLHAIADSVV